MKGNPDAKAGINISAIPKISKISLRGKYESDMFDGPQVIKKMEMGELEEWTRGMEWHPGLLLKRPNEKFNVYTSKDGKIITEDKKAGCPYSYQSGTKSLKMAPRQLVDTLAMKNRTYKYQFQDTILDTEKACNESLLGSICHAIHYGGVHSNDLCYSEPGSYVPLRYYDTNCLRYQVSGRRKLVFFNPASYTSLYPFPVSHPADKFSQVGDYLHNGTQPPDGKFPRYMSAGEGGKFTCELLPGEVLCLPQYWWIYELPSKEAVTTLTLYCIPEQQKSKLVEHGYRRTLELLLNGKLESTEAHKLWSCIDLGFIPSTGFHRDGLNTILEKTQRHIGGTRHSVLLRV